MASSVPSPLYTVSMLFVIFAFALFGMFGMYSRLEDSTQQQVKHGLGLAGGLLLSFSVLGLVIVYVGQNLADVTPGLYR
jgi:Na+/H+ antiporter NhaC